MKLTNVAVCIDCEEVFEYEKKNGNGHCPCCGSHSWTPLSKYFKPLAEAVERIDKYTLAKKLEEQGQESGRKMLESIKENYDIS
jgi:hypothetical protein